MIYVVPERPSDPQQSARARDLQRELEQIRRDNRDADQAWERNWWAMVKREFVLTSDHIKLLKAMRFQIVQDTDWMSVTADGKRPFGNSDWVEDIYNELGWTRQYDEEGLTGECIQRAQRIMAELPMALNQVIAGLPS